MANRGAVRPENWGKDHFSTLLYLETRIVDYSGVVRGEQMRARDSSYSCRLRSGEKKNHGDYDCIEDMIAAGLVIGGGRNKFSDYERGKGPNPNLEPFKPFKLTEKGWRLAHLLRRWKGGGKNKSLLPVELVLEAIREEPK